MSREQGPLCLGRMSSLKEEKGGLTGRGERILWYRTEESNGRSFKKGGKKGLPLTGREGPEKGVASSPVSQRGIIELI